jgi:hypothetical protein
MSVFHRLSYCAFVGAIVAAPQLAWAEDGTSQVLQGGTSAQYLQGSASAQYMQGGASVFDAGVLRGQASVLDAPMLQGGARTGSLTSGLGQHKFKVGEARMAPVTSSYAAKLSSGGLNARTKQLMFKAFAKMTCVEYNQLQANSYSVEYNYRPVSFNQTLALPGFYGNSVQVFTDGKRLVAIDPRSLETWVADARCDVGRRSSWRKLIHIK